MIFKEKRNNAELCAFFDKQVALAMNAAEELRVLFMRLDRDQSVMNILFCKKRIHILENQGDVLIREIGDFLDSRSFMRLEHDDSHLLAGRLDDVLDGIDAVALRANCYGISDIRTEAHALAGVIMMMTTQLSNLLSCVLNLDQEEAQKWIVTIHNAEHEADVILEEGLTRLHRETEDAKYILQWEKILDLLEEVTDQIQHAADAIEMIIRKYA